MTFPLSDMEFDEDTRLGRALAASTSDQVEKYVREEIRSCVDQLRTLMDEASDEEIYESVIEFGGKNVSEWEKNTLAEILGIN